MKRRIVLVSMAAVVLGGGGVGAGFAISQHSSQSDGGDDGWAGQDGVTDDEGGTSHPSDAVDPNAYAQGQRRGQTIAQYYSNQPLHSAQFDCQSSARTFYRGSPLSQDAYFSACISAAGG